ncbi:MAG: response regulator [Candidatus Bathyarchaeota archaeon]|nr:response regulator [Candidatus Bathyarchaeota archaeon]
MQGARKGETAKGLAPGMPVLIVDDDAFLTDAFQLILEDAGFYVETAATGMQALSKAEATPFKLVITDLKLPDIAGDELSRRLKEMIPGVSVILLTGMSSLQNRGEKAPDKILMKPIDSLELLRVSNSLSSHM